MNDSENKSKELRYADYQVVVERSVGVKVPLSILNNSDVSGVNQTILTQDMKWCFWWFNEKNIAIS
jgi:hypothetical protein